MHNRLQALKATIGAYYHQLGATQTWKAVCNVIVPMAGCWLPAQRTRIFYIVPEFSGKIWTDPARLASWHRQPQSSSAALASVATTDPPATAAPVSRNASSPHCSLRVRKSDQSNSGNGATGSPSLTLASGCGIVQWRYISLMEHY